MSSPGQPDTLQAPSITPTRDIPSTLLESHSSVPPQQSTSPFSLAPHTASPTSVQQVHSSSPLNSLVQSRSGSPFQLPVHHGLSTPPISLPRKAQASPFTPSSSTPSPTSETFTLQASGGNHSPATYAEGRYMHTALGCRSTNSSEFLSFVTSKLQEVCFSLQYAY